MKTLSLLSLMLLCFTLSVQGQYVGQINYDFRDNGVLFGAGQSADGKLVLSPANGSYQHGNTYGLALKVGSTITIQVAGSSTIRFTGSKHSRLDVSGTAINAGDLGTQPGQTTNDFETFDFVYSGLAKTLTFNVVAATGNDLYLPQIAVIPAQAGKDFATADLNIPYFFDLRNQSIYASGAGNNVTAGLFSITAGCCNGLSLNGSQHGITFKPGNKITLKVAGNSYIRIAGDQFSETNPAITASSTTGTFDNPVQSNKTAITYPQGADGGPWVDFLYSGTAGTVELLCTGSATSYLPYIEISPIPYDIRSWEQKSGTVTINGTVLTYTAGIDEESNPTLSLTKGHVTDLSFDEAAIRIDLGGDVLSSFTPAVSGDVVSVSINGDVLTLHFADESSDPTSYTVHVTDGSIIDVWDFGAEQLANTQTETYKNWLTNEAINAWYDPAITPGATGINMPSTFSSGAFTWVGGTNDRLRTTNTNLTRFDQNTKGSFTGRLYINANPAPDRRFTISLNKDDELTLWMYAENADGQLHFQNAESGQDDVAIVPISTVTEVRFVAKSTGTYVIYDAASKPSYMRIYRQDANYIYVTGTVDESAAAGISEGYSLVFTNKSGNERTVLVQNTTYGVSLPAGYTYSISLVDANGYVVSEGTTLEVTENTTTHNLSIEKVELYTITGNILGLGQAISNLTLTYTPDPSAEKIYIPEPIIDTDNATYTVQFEPNVEYTISASGVNDFEITSNVILVTGDQTSDIVFSPKTTYDIGITTEGLNANQLENLILTFTNLNEEGYVYEFSSVSEITLRDGTYVISYAGLDDFAVEMALTSLLKVDGENASKNLSFVPIKKWTFDDPKLNGLPAHKGLLFTGNIGSEPAKSHLTAKPEATIQIPVNVGEKIGIYYYYTADFSIEGGEPITTNSQSTSFIESTDYVYEGTEAGYVTLVFGASASTSYITDITIGQVVPFDADITVGTDKDYATINDALAAIRSMDRPNDERVTIHIDAGNYEEMLVIDVPNVTLKNAASTPSIGLTNKGVDIASGAVRVTSYYGHGYNYYSMGSDQKYNAELLQVNKENGFNSYVNTGAGTTNGSYWNATVVVFASGFEAENIIFENSFNQYISLKESQDVVVEKSDGKGTRPTTVGSTDVQNRSFVERAAALAIGNNVDKVVLDNCRVVGRQDSFFGGVGSRVAIYRGAYMGAVDYIFGGMNAVFYKSELVMNVSDASNDAAYLTAAQQSSGRGYLMYECTVTSAEPNIETASTMRAKPGYFGRPWQANTSEVVFYNTTIETSNYTGSEGLSLIAPAGWQNSLGGESNKMYEYGTIELSGVNNATNRAAWSTVLTTAQLTDGTDITLFNFTKGSDNWDPFADLIDSNNLLASLSIAEGTLSPSFDPEVTNYAVEVPDGTTQVTINASAQSAYASVEIGTSQIPGSTGITVIAENGSTKIYNITISVTPPLSAKDGFNQRLILYPNPSTSLTTVSFHLNRIENVAIKVIDIQGKVVQQLMKPRMNSGDHEIEIETDSLTPGIYICQLETDSRTERTKLMIK